MRLLAPLPLGITEKYRSGKLRSIVNDSSSAAETYLAHSLPDKAGAITTPIGLLFLLLSLSPLRERLNDALPMPFKFALSAGVGLFLTLSGLINAGLIMADENLVDMGTLAAPEPLLALLGIFFTAVLVMKRVPGAMMLGMALTALAGPLANLIAAYLGALVFYAIGIFAPYNTVVAYILIFFNYYAMINTVLAVFNLVPIPPLDGSKILASFLSDRARFKFYQYQNVLSMVGMILLVSGTLSGPIGMAENLVYSGVRWLALVPFRMLGLA